MSVGTVNDGEFVMSPAAESWPMRRSRRVPAVGSVCMFTATQNDLT